MTKEEIIRNGKHFFRDQVDDLQKQFGGYFVAAIEGIMDEYAKQQSMAFMQWAIENCMIAGDYDGKAGIAITDETYDSLYEKFLEDQSKKFL